jgi:hypothetical protein
MAKRKKKDQKLFLGYYAVAFMDLLGQQDFLRNFHFLPNPDDQHDMDATREQLKNTYGAVTGMRKFFNDAFEAYSKRPINIGLRELSAERRREFNALTNNPIKFYSFSDSVAIFMSLRTDTAKHPMRGILGIFSAAATTFVCCLAAGHPIRGAIDVGLGMEITKNEIYGPALSRAYTLESRVANYPRIIVGNDLVSYLEKTRDQQPTDITSEVEKYVAERCFECLAIDDDGYQYVDYLGEFYRRMFGEVIDVTVIQKAYSHVLNATEKYQKEKNSKLAFRYKLLRNYFEERLPVWEDLLKKKKGVSPSDQVINKQGYKQFSASLTGA